MSTSYQDIDQRLRVIEDKVDFFMGTMRMRAVVQTGVLDATGNPVGNQTFEGTFLDFYHLQRQGKIEQVPPALPEGTSPASELTNGL